MQNPRQLQQKLSKAILSGPRPSDTKQIAHNAKQAKSKTKRQDSDTWADEPNMSDTGLLVTVEDLINLAFGPHDINKVNFKIIRMIINMLANQLRLLDKKVQLNTEMMVTREAAAAAAEEAKKSPGKKSETGEFSDVFMEDEDDDFKSVAGKLESKKSVADARKDIKKIDKKESVSEAKKSVADARKDIQRMEKKEGVLEAKKSVTDARKDIQRMEKSLEAKKSVTDARKDIQRMEKKETSTKKLKTKDKKEAREKISTEAENLHRTESSVREIGGIEVVPMSRFMQLEEIIQDLKKKMTAPPIPKLPDNKKLRDDLEKGTASLTDTMNALSLAARVQAAENAIDRLSILITKLASETTLHDELEKEEKSPLQKKSDQKIVKETRKYQEEGKEKEVIVYVKELEVSRETFLKAHSSTHGHLQAIKSGLMKSSQSIYGKSNKVTYDEMNEKMRELGDSLLKKFNDITGYATTAAENALMVVTALSNKLEVALGLDSRITLITTIVHDYVQEMRGLDTSKDIQMANFQEQLNQMLNELRAGMDLLTKYDKNAQNTAIMELNEFYELLVQELEDSVERHQKAVLVQEQLGLEIRSLVGSIEALRAQKADRDEVADGLKDKADISRLRGLLKEKIFITGQMNLESRLLICHDKFRKQEETWLLVIKDFTELTKLKADIQHVFEAKETMQEGLQDVYKKLQLLARVLGDPKAAVVTRKMEMSASCGACKTSARLDTGARTEELAVKLPSLGKQNRQLLSQGDRDQEAMWELLDVPVDRKHVCHRWAGGSHTIMPASITVQKAPRRFPSAPPMEAYDFIGHDGKPYRCSRRLEPCLCNDPVEGPQVKW